MPVTTVLVRLVYYYAFGLPTPPHTLHTGSVHTLLYRIFTRLRLLVAAVTCAFTVTFVTCHVYRLPVTTRFGCLRSAFTTHCVYVAAFTVTTLTVVTLRSHIYYITTLPRSLPHRTGSGFRWCLYTLPTHHTSLPHRCLRLDYRCLRLLFTFPFLPAFAFVTFTPCVPIYVLRTGYHTFAVPLPRLLPFVCYHVCVWFARLRLRLRSGCVGLRSCVCGYVGCVYGLPVTGLHLPVIYIHCVVRTPTVGSRYLRYTHVRYTHRTGSTPGWFLPPLHTATACLALPDSAVLPGSRSLRLDYLPYAVLVLRFTHAFTPYVTPFAFYYTHGYTFRL